MHVIFSSFNFPIPLLFSLLTLVACNSQGQGDLPAEIETNTKQATMQTAFTFPDLVSTLSPGQYVFRDSANQVGEYVREIFPDSKGNLWFGTLVRGVGRYDGNTLVYFTTEEGLVGNQINGIAEDKLGNIWFSTIAGISKYDGISFTNFTTEDGLSDNNTWCIMIDKKDQVWVGTMGGVSRYDGAQFTDFKLPKAAIDKPTTIFSTDLVWDMIEDQKGNIWFGTDGVGVVKYDGQSFTHLTQKDGLKSNDVYDIFEDSRGDIWFGCRNTRVPSSENPHHFVDSTDAGLCRYDGKRFTQFPDIEGFNNHLIGPIYEDRAGQVWIGSMHRGVYRYNGEHFVNFKEDKGYTINCIQSIAEDKDGRLWFGFSGGLFRLEKSVFVNIKKDGPW